MTASRARDEDGRPLNRRPRDAAGRPLPPGSEGVERIDESVVLPPAEALTEAQRLLDAGFPFHAHEVLEGAWKAAPTDERPFWQGLAQLAVGLTHAQRGNARGAAALLRRGADNVSGGARAAGHHGVDAAAVAAWAGSRADDVETLGLAATPSVPTVTLVSPRPGPGKSGPSRSLEEEN